MGEDKLGEAVGEVPQTQIMECSSKCIYTLTCLIGFFFPPKTKPLSVVKFDLELMILPWLQVHAPMLGHPAIVLFYGYE